MVIMQPGYFPDTYYPDRYWSADYWAEYGLPSIIRGTASTSHQLLSSVSVSRRRGTPTSSGFGASLGTSSRGSSPEISNVLDSEIAIQ